MKEYVYEPEGVCPMQITFDIEGDVIHNIRFMGGCNGNLKAISKLVEGKRADEIADILEGNLCANRGTSCADQFSKALREALAE